MEEKRMLNINRFWMWENATEGMDVYLLDRENDNHELIKGMIIEVGREVKIRFIDGKPVSNSKVKYVVIMIEGGKKITVLRSRNMQQYQILLR